jgi:hypothetical protein
MRELTPDEIITKARRKAAFQQFVDERVPVLLELANSLQFAREDRIVLEPWLFLANLDTWLAEQEITAEDRVWAVSRIGYWIGEAIVVRYDGRWFLNDIPGSRYFLRYVVGKCARLRNSNAMVDPLLVADSLLAEPPGRRLSKIMEEVCAELEAT